MENAIKTIKQLLLILDVLYGKMVSANNAQKDGILAHKTFVFLSVIFALPGVKKVLVNHVIMVILLNKVYALKTMTLVLSQIVIYYVKFGPNKFVLNALIELSSIKMESVLL
jgi:hypothetical protein